MKATLEILLAGRDLSFEEARGAMDGVMAGEATPAQIAAFLVALRAKGETVTEITGMVDTLLEFATPISVPGPAVDVVGSGGVQYSDMTGGLGGTRGSVGGNVRESDSRAYSVSASAGSPARTGGTARGTDLPSGRGTANTTRSGSEMPSLGIKSGFGSGLAAGGGASSLGGSSNSSRSNAGTASSVSELSVWPV